MLYLFVKLELSILELQCEVKQLLIFHARYSEVQCLFSAEYHIFAKSSAF